MTAWHVFCVLCTVVPLARYYLQDALIWFNEQADDQLRADIELAKQDARVPLGGEYRAIMDGFTRITSDQQMREALIMMECMEKAESDNDYRIAAMRADLEQP